MTCDDNKRLPSYDTVASALSYLRAKSQPSETHGLLSALLTGNVRLQRHAWIDSLLTGHFEKGDVLAQEAQQVLLQLFDHSEHYFTDGQDLQFELLLPDDEAGIEMRIESLAEWCQGYLSGLNLMHINDSTVDCDDVKEALQDLTKMACLCHDDEQDGDEEIEAAFMELVEFARVAVMLMHDYVISRHQNQKWTIDGNDTCH